MSHDLAKKYLTINQFVEQMPAFTHGSIRHMIFHSDKNGFDMCVRRIASKIFINVDKFEEWVESGESAKWTYGKDDRVKR